MVNGQHAPVFARPERGHHGKSARKVMSEKSAFFTLGVLPDHADNKDSLKAILETIHDLYRIDTYQLISLGCWSPEVVQQHAAAETTLRC